ncbi:zinc finger protein 2 isoform X1 [Cryptotermes secundus]|uniref:zinc finger protein 2 isoform X1 n=2 Tax=Cryptotermes secundus TaxID=105785 RepID=UPI000CD7C111|nr:zinc finger protein 2 isoform X1 [Cryptotermes secundus]
MGTAPNLDKLCRICTDEQTDNILIFSEEGKKLYLEAKMKKYLHIAVSVEDILPKMVCTNCCKKLDSIHRFACMAVKMQDKLKMLLETPSSVEEVKKEHSILHSILSKGTEPECEVTEVEVRVDPMLFLCALEEDGSSGGEDTTSDNSFHQTSAALNDTEQQPLPLPPSSQLSIVPPASPAIVGKEMKPYRCSVCSRGFNNEIGLQNHLWSHLPPGRRILTNTDSNNQLQRQSPVYSSRGVLHTNTNPVTNSNNMRFVCPICGKKISTKGNLKVHLETHRPKGKYGCDICGRVFKTQSNLYRHKDYHGGIQFPCVVCGRVYPTNSTLRAHSITHSDLRPHACPLCDKTFKRNQDLKFHINQHTGARPYQCPYCPKAFASSGNCFSHRKRMHPQEVERDRERAAQIMR